LAGVKCPGARGFCGVGQDIFCATHLGLPHVIGMLRGSRKDIVGKLSISLGPLSRGEAGEMSSMPIKRSSNLFQRVV